MAVRLNKKVGRPIMAAGAQYPSVLEAARVLGVHHATIQSRVLSQSPAFKDWYFTDGLPTPDYSGKNKRRKAYIFSCYTITEPVTGKKYIGSTLLPANRKAAHLSRLRKGIHSSPRLQAIYDAVGEDRLEWGLILCHNREHMLDREQTLIDEALQSGLLLNDSVSVRNAIFHNLQKPGIEEKRLTALKRFIEENKAAFSRKASKGSLKRWDQPGAREAIRGAGNPFAKPVTVDGVTYGSVKDAVKGIGVGEKTIRLRARDPTWPNYSFPSSIS